MGYISNRSLYGAVMALIIGLAEIHLNDIRGILWPLVGANKGHVVDQVGANVGKAPKNRH